jgi:hypothetical protein
MNKNWFQEKRFGKIVELMQDKNNKLNPENHNLEEEYLAQTYKKFPIKVIVLKDKKNENRIFIALHVSSFEPLAARKLHCLKNKEFLISYLHISNSEGITLMPEKRFFKTGNVKKGFTGKGISTGLISEAIHKANELNPIQSIKIGSSVENSRWIKKLTEIGGIQKMPRIPSYSIHAREIHWNPAHKKHKNYLKTRLKRK